MYMVIVVRDQNVSKHRFQKRGLATDFAITQYNTLKINGSANIVRNRQGHYSLVSTSK